MKIVVVADVHGHLAKLISIIEDNRDMNALIFLGDGMNDLEDIQAGYAGFKIYAVSGNCDRCSLYPSESLATFGGLLTFYTHGHTYSVKTGMDELKHRGMQAGAEIILFGHTHSPYYEEFGETFIFNPGSVADSRIGKSTYGIITIQDEKPQFLHKEI